MAELNRILLVEDEPDIQAVAKMALESVGGFTVKGVDSGAEALKVIGDFDPELVLLDVMMPGMDGPEVLASLRQAPATQHLPVVFMTAKVQSTEVEQFKQLGAVDVISKPFDPMTLSDQVRDIWSRVPA